MSLWLVLLLAIGVQEPLVSVRTPELVWLSAGSRGAVELQLKFRDDVHVQAPPTEDPFLVPLELIPDEIDGLEIVEIRYPEGVPGKLDSEGRIYEGTITLLVTIASTAATDRGLREVRGTLSYQACGSGRCYRPEELEIAIPVRLGR